MESMTLDSPALQEMCELVGFLARTLVDKPDEVYVDPVIEDKQIVLELSVAPDDLGKVIGKEGRTARAMRALLSATSARHNVRAILEIMEDDDDLDDDNNT